MGAATRFMTSAPVPIDHMIGMRPIMAALTVIPPQVEVDEVAAGGALGEGAARAGHVPQGRLDLGADALDLGEVGAVDLDPHRGADAGGEHVDAGLDRHRPGVRLARQPQRLVHLRHQLVPGDPVPPDAPQDVLGQLFIRSSERAERIYGAMCARGWR